MKRIMCLVALAALAGAARAATFDEGLALKKQNKLAEAEGVFAEVVREHPEDGAALAEWATLLGWLGRFDDSIAAWTRALAQRPDDPDAQTALARVQYWKGQLGPARQRLDALLAAQPDRVEALALAGDVCAAQRDGDCARARYGRAQELAPSAELERKLAASAGPPRLRVDAGGQIDRYDTGRGTEGSFFAQASWHALAPLVLSAGYEQLRQFGATDHRVNAGAYLHPLDRLVVSARVAVSPTAHTVASWEASGGAELRVAGPATALASVRHLDFPGQGVTIFGAGARVDVGRLSIAAQGGVVHSTVASIEGFGAARVEVAATDALHVYAGLARGAQAQLLLPTATATDVTAGAIWQLDRTYGVRLDYTFEQFGDFYARHSLGSALTARF